MAIEAVNIARKYSVPVILLSDQGIAGGVFDPAIDVSVAVNGILSLMNSTTRWHRPTGRRSFREISEWYKRFIVHGLMTGEVPVGAGTNSATSLAD